MVLVDPLQLTGTTIADKYAIEAVVGEGGFAVVYRARHLIWKRPVAIKAFKALGDLGEESRQGLLDAFVQEGALLADLSERSAAICQARDIGTLETSRGGWIPYMVLEWLEGVTLEQALGSERSRGMAPRTAEQAAALLEPAAEALALAHRKGIAHRDVKPGNIFLLGDPRAESCPVKILDFGIAKVVQDAQKQAGSFAKTTGQVTSFTPAYGAPEQFSRAHGSTGPWTDVFALALIFSEVVSGKDPLEGDNLAQLAYASMDATRRPTPRALGATTSDAVDAVITKALAVVTHDRYGTAGEFWNALRVALGQAPLRGIVTGRDPGSLTPPPMGVASAASVAPPPALATAAAMAPLRTGATDLTATPGSAATATHTIAGEPRRPARTLLGAGAALVILGGLGAFLVARRGPTPAPAAASAAAVVVPAPAKPSCAAGMIRIPGGKFFMGSDDKSDLELERPAHQVTLSPYCIDTYEVTVADYKGCSDKGECKRAGTTNDWKGIGEADRKAFDPLCNAREPEAKAQHPVNCVDWEMAAAYCKAHARRLPTEAEWEFAARGPDGRKYPWGDEEPSAGHLNACGKECVAWGKRNHVEEEAMYAADDGFPNTAPVGSFPQGASRYGVQDVVGNVWEWVADWYAPYTADAEEEPKGPREQPVASAGAASEGRVIRGGAWNGAQPSWVRPTFRYHDVPEKRSYGVGFRCASSFAD
jgi:formylglycine-generating enzyme required for sulfatase activity